MNTIDKEYNIRLPIPDDVPFIYSTWLNSFKRDSHIGKAIRDQLFFDEYRFVADHILNQSKLLVACHKDDENVMFGYVIYNGAVLHYVYVKEAFRKLGIATNLIEQALKQDGIDKFVYCTHRTFAGDKIQHDLIHNPFILYQSGKET